MVFLSIQSNLALVSSYFQINDEATHSPGSNRIHLAMYIFVV
jgi:hypothetical protein